MFDGHFVVLQKAPFRHAKRPISGSEKHHIAPQYRLYRTTKWAISESKKNIFGLRYGVYEKAIYGETGFITPDLTSLYISFAKIFCQNKVKKNWRYVFQFSFKNVDFRCKEKRGKDVLTLRLLCIGCGNADLLLRNKYNVIVYKAAHSYWFFRNQMSFHE